MMSITRRVFGLVTGRSRVLNVFVLGLLAGSAQGAHKSLAATLDGVLRARLTAVRDTTKDMEALVTALTKDLEEKSKEIEDSGGCFRFGLIRRQELVEDVLVVLEPQVEPGSEGDPRDRVPIPRERVHPRDALQGHQVRGVCSRSS